jgi:hypothetical protein
MSSGGCGWAGPVVPGCASSLAYLVLTPSNVVMTAAITATGSATAKIATAVRRLFRSLFMTSLLRQRTPLDGWGSSAGRLAAYLTAQYPNRPRRVSRMAIGTLGMKPASCDDCCGMCAENRGPVEIVLPSLLDPRCPRLGNEKRRH